MGCAPAAASPLPAATLSSTLTLALALAPALAATLTSSLALALAPALALALTQGVNNAEGALAWPAMAYRLHGNRTQGLRSMDLVLRMIDTYQAQPNALLCADEVFCGRAAHRGTETCAVVEAMASLEQGFAVLNEPALFDRVERLAFNALPAALTADMWTHVYVQQANSIWLG